METVGRRRARETDTEEEEREPTDQRGSRGWGLGALLTDGLLWGPQG